MKVISSYQKLKLRIAELEKEKYELEKAIVEDNFQVLYNVKNLWRIRADMDRSLLFGERNSGAGLTEHIRKYPTTFAEAFKAEANDSLHPKRKVSRPNLNNLLPLLPDWFKKKKD